jgi:ABC-type glutathione transport system ATPase component
LSCCSLRAARGRGGGRGISILISHDLAVVRQLTDQAIVLRHGRVVERGPTPRVLDDPQHDYTRLLRACVPRPGWKPRRHGAAVTRPG